MRATYDTASTPDLHEDRGMVTITPPSFVFFRSAQAPPQDPDDEPDQRTPTTTMISVANQWSANHRAASNDPATPRKSQR